MAATEDVIASLAGIAPGSPLAAIRAIREQARDQAQASYRALFEPQIPGALGLSERFAVAVFVAALHTEPESVAFYRARLAESGADSAWPGAIDAAADAGATHGPYGHYPSGPLSREDVPGTEYRVPADARAALGPRLAAAFEHTHMLVFHPRDSAPERLRPLLDAGWSTDGIVTLSQLVAFLSFQIRAAAGLRVLAAS